MAAGNYGAIIVAFITGAVLTHRLGAEQYGVLALLVMAMQVLLLFVVNWTHVGFIHFGAKEYATTNKVVTTLWARNAVVAPWAISAGLIVFLARQPLATYLGTPTPGLLLVFIHFLASYGLATLGGVFQAREEMRRYGMALLLEKSTTLALIALLPVAWIGTPLRVIGAYAASAAAVCAWSVVVLGWRTLGPAHVNWVAVRSMWRYSLPLIFAGWSGVLGTNWLDFIVIRRYLELSDLGHYALATQLAGVVQQMSIVFSTLLLPRLSVMVARNDDSGIRQFTERLLPYWFLATSLLFGCVLLVAPLVVPFVFGTEFAAAVRPLAILMLATSALTFFNAFAPLLSSYGMMWQIATICFFSAALNVGLNFALIPRFGLEGSAVATGLAYGLSAAAVLVLARARLSAGVYRLPVLALPLGLVVAACLAFEGATFYLAAPLVLVGSSYLLLRLFGLCGREDMIWLRNAVASAFLRSPRTPER